MAFDSANYEFNYVNVGAEGRQSVGGIIMERIFNEEVNG